MNNFTQENITTESVIVSYDHSTKVMCVGKKRMNESVEIVNAFQGEKAENLWKQLNTKEA